MVSQALHEKTASFLGMTPGDPVMAKLGEKMLEILRPLMGVNSPHTLRRLVRDAAYQYAPIKQLLGSKITAYAQGQRLHNEELMKKLVEALYEAVAQAGDKDDAYLVTSDRAILVDIARTQYDIGYLVQNTPTENKPDLHAAMIDSYWPLVRLDFCMSAILIILSGDIHPENPKIPHWLFLIARDSVEEIRTALFVNNPELRQRLSRPFDQLDLIPADEVERRLGV